jgi:hypothetical protein
MAAWRWAATALLVGLIAGLLYHVHRENLRWDAALGRRVAAAALQAEADGEPNRALALLRAASALGAGRDTDARLVRLSVHAHREWALPASPTALAFAGDRIDLRLSDDEIIEVDPATGTVSVGSRTADPAPGEDPITGFWSGDLFFSGAGRKASLYRKGQQLILEAPVGRVVAAGFGADRTLAVATADRRLHLWSLGDLPEVGAVPEAVAPQREARIQGRRVEILDGTQIVAEANVDVDVRAGALVGKTLVVATGADEIAARKGDHVLWRRSDPEVDGLAARPQGDLVLARHPDGRLILYDIRDGEPLASWRGPASLGEDIPFGFSADGNDAFLGRIGFRVPEREAAAVRRTIGRESNLRPCPADLRVVAVTPYPSAASIWADDTACGVAP